MSTSPLASAGAPEDAASEPLRPQRTRWQRIRSSFWFNLVVAFVVLALVQSFVVRLYFVPSASMENTVMTGDRVIVNRLAFIGGGPARGDVVVFNARGDFAPPPRDDPWFEAMLRNFGSATGFGISNDDVLIKRVIGTPGDVISTDPDTGGVLVNGELLDEPYVDVSFPFEPGTLDCSTTSRSMACFPEITVPENNYFVLGDNRTNSADSLAACRAPASGAAPDASCARFVSRHDLIGDAFAVVLPPSNWGGL